MNLVVVFLSEVREYIIVPENYIFGLNIKDVKNLGKNSSRDYLVYFSDDCVEGTFYPDPIQNATESSQFPAGSGSWYRGRIIHFTGMIIFS